MNRCVLTYIVGPILHASIRSEFSSGLPNSTSPGFEAFASLLQTGRCGTAESKRATVARRSYLTFERTLAMHLAVTVWSRHSYLTIGVAEDSNRGTFCTRHLEALL